ncbi:MAG: hypothetical protein EPN43_14075 [Jatrophihabitans sp.]|nr:MAG: hypothetical protein EPN43_14075 [Jatrophihabitans sp.]
MADTFLPDPGIAPGIGAREAGHPTDGRLIPAVVPLQALPVVALLVAGLIVSIAGNWKWALDWYHVVGGGLWTSIDLFVGMVLGPIMGRLSPPARAEFAARFMPAMVVIMPTVVTMTLAAGWQVARQTGNLEAPYPHRWWITASMIVVAIMAVVALGILEPANLAVLFEMRKPVPDTVLIAQLMRRFVYFAGVTGVMQIATLVIMTRVATS